jgi:hypothetical protein
MRSLNLPTYSFKIKSEAGKDYIFDTFRKKFVFLSPEEWVRQNFAMFLINERGYPMGRIVIEKSLRYNKLSKRCDILVYDDTFNPVLMVECKAPGIKIGPSVFDQIAIYNLTFKVQYLIVTNGINHYCARIEFQNSKVNFIDDIPEYESIIGE